MCIVRFSVQQEKFTQNVVDFSLINNLIEKNKRKKGNMIPLVQEARVIYSYLPAHAMEKIAQETNLELNDRCGVATFYAQFGLTPAGKHSIKVCGDKAGHVQKSLTIT